MAGPPQTGGIGGPAHLLSGIIRKSVDKIVRQPAFVDHAYERGCQPDVRDVFGDVLGHAAMHFDNAAGIPVRRDVLPDGQPSTSANVVPLTMTPMIYSTPLIVLRAVR